jgi:hypothetical protein
MTPRHFIGRTLYRFYHAPLGRLRRTFAGGGPWQQRRTEQGRWDMEAAVPRLPALPAATAGVVPLALHVLTGKNYWYQTAFCLHSFATHARRPIAPAIHDDGSLTPAQTEVLTRLFPLGAIVRYAETTARLDRLLPRSRHPVLRERWDRYPHIRKLVNPHLGSTGWKLVLDSDLLFFREPALLLSWLDAPAAPLHAVDVRRSYGYSDTLLRSLASAPLADRLNVGLCGLRSDELDWDRIERLCRTLIAAEKTNYFLEQALVAILLAGRACIAAPAADYVTMPARTEARACRAVMHHYSADSKRWYFQTNWRRSVAAAAPPPSA